MTGFVSREASTHACDRSSFFFIFCLYVSFSDRISFAYHLNYLLKLELIRCITFFYVCIMWKNFHGWQSKGIVTQVRRWRATRAVISSNSENYQNFFASIQLRIGISSGYFAAAQSPHSGAHLSRIHFINCVPSGQQLSAKHGMSPFHWLRPLHRLYRPHLLLSARRRVTTDCVRGTTCIHIGSATPDKKLSFPFPPRFNYLFTFATPEYSGAAPLHHYSKFTRHSGLRHYFVITNIFGYLVNFFFRLWIYLLRLSEIIFFGSVEVFSST